jgi:hypothetical protein
MVAFIDGDSGKIHEEAVDPAGYPRSDILDPRFIVVYFAHHPNLSSDEFALHS